MADGFEDDLERLTGQISGEAQGAEPQGGPNPKDEALAALGDKSAQQEDQRKEERFLFVLVIIVMFDAIVFTHMESWSGAIVIGVIELFGLMVFARHCGIEEVQSLLDKVLHSWRSRRT